MCECVCSEAGALFDSYLSGCTRVHTMCACTYLCVYVYTLICIVATYVNIYTVIRYTHLPCNRVGGIDSIKSDDQPCTNHASCAHCIGGGREGGRLERCPYFRDRFVHKSMLLGPQKLS